MNRLARNLVKIRRIFRSQRIKSAALIIFLPLLITLVSYSLFYLAKDVKFVGNIADQAMGTRMNLFADSEKPRAGAHSILFLDFDDETSMRLNDPVLVPPRTTARALARLAEMHPWAVLVDIDLASAQDAEDIAELRRSLSALVQSGAVVLLGRDTIPIAGSPRRVRLRPSPLDSFVANTPGVLWVSIAYNASDDGVVRTMQSVQRADLGTRRILLPSAPLALKLLAMEGSARRLDQVVSLGLSGRSACGTKGARDMRFCTASGPLDIDPDAPSLIEYSFRWVRAPEQHYRVPNSPASAPQILRVPMYPILRGGSLDAGLFRDALIVVGATAGRRDVRPTPIDSMPGAFVLANASRAWIEFGPRRDSYLAGLFLVLLGMLTLTALTWLLLTFTPRSWQRHMRGQLATVLTAVLWVIFLIAGNPAAAIGLVVTAYLVVNTVRFCHEHDERLRSTSAKPAEGSPACNTIPQA